jgi:hypothetical protein
MSTTGDAAMRRRPRARRTLAAFLVLPGVAVVVAAPTTAHAITAEKTFQYSCELPVVGVQQIPITLAATTADTLIAGQPIAVQTKADVAVPANVQAALPIIGAASADLDSVLKTTWSGAVTGNYDGQLSVRGSAPPASGPWLISGDATYPSVPTSGPGTATVTVGTIDLTLTLRRADGGLTGLGVVQTGCTLIAGQDAVLSTITISGGDPGTPGPTAPPATPAPTAPPATPAPAAPTPTRPTTPPATAAAAASAPTAATTTTISETDATVPDYGGLVALYYTLRGRAELNRVGTAALLEGGKLTTLLNLQDGKWFGEFTFPETVARFRLAGLIPVTARITLTQEAPAYGTIRNGVVEATARAQMRVLSLSFGRLGVSPGKTCATSAAIELALASGPNFNPLQGGRVAGAFFVPPFGECGMVGSLADLVITGPGNRLVLDLVPFQP